MKNKALTLFCTLLLFLSISCTEQEQVQEKIQIIPYPQKVVPGKGAFSINEKTAIVAGQGAERTAVFFHKIFEKDHDLQLSTKDKKDKNTIAFQLDKSLEASTGKEGYQLNISKSGIEISAASETGLFYGVQTIRQLLLANATPEAIEKGELALPCLEITDYPRFSWRAYMLDDSRYFNGLPFVKKMLDQMALLKMNVFHWHLVDDAGWRIEIKKYPKLTEIGSKRKDSEIETWESGKLSGEPHGGFYTQEQIKEIVAYAAENGYELVNSLHSETYLDYNLKSIPLERAYNFDPIPKDLPQEYHQQVKGTGCQMWTEWTPTTKDVERQTFPRIAAYAEVGWTLPAKKNFDQFKESLEMLKMHWTKVGIGM